MNDNYQKQQELETARARDRSRNISNTAKDIKDIVQSRTPQGMLKTLRRFSLTSDWMYLLAIFAAIFKDVVDLIEFAVITYIIVIVVTVCISIFIGMMMVLGGKTRFICWIILLIGTIIEMIFGINIMPAETTMVFIIYSLNQSERRREQKK